MSALLLQLVQTSAHDVRMGAERIRRAGIRAVQTHNSPEGNHAGAFLEAHHLTVCPLCLTVKLFRETELTAGDSAVPDCLGPSDEGSEVNHHVSDCKVCSVLY